MHPAKSVIFFTTSSGAGYGLIVIAAVLDCLGMVPPDATATIALIGCAVVLIVAGLLSSTFHLGHPERAWRALSQWRSSWLSREGVAAVATFVPIGAYALLRLVGDPASMVTLGAGLAAALGSLATVYCTAMIYASLRPVHAWATAWTPVAYVALALMTGAVLFNAIAGVLGFSEPVAAMIAMVLIVAGLGAKAGYWMRMDRRAAVSTPETATGLAALGKVRLLEAPHSEANYLMKEMGFRIARKHAGKLRIVAVCLGFVIPCLSVAGALVPGAAGGIAVGLAAFIVMIPGILTERWLFFAEAKHAVGLYYGLT
jgi:sulfite dehydrogenase (quinone) subunit SoeC